jgi:cyclic pyranopterin phosphate synthase
MTGLSHMDERGDARMVDVGEKPETERVATAAGAVRMAPETLERVRRDDLPKGAVLHTARLAGIMAAKRTDELIPLCHSLPLSAVAVEFAFDDALPGVRVEATARTRARTGVEMEALTAVSVAALTLYDMVKAVDKAMVIEGVRLVYKSGGRSGEYRTP